MTKNDMSTSATPGTPSPLLPPPPHGTSLADVEQQLRRPFKPSPLIPLLQKACAEFVCTFIIVFSSAAGPILNQKYNGVQTLMGNAACSGLAVMISVLCVGHISGAHFNPAVTLAFATLRYFSWLLVPVYLVSQVAASVFACFILKVAYHPFLNGGVTVPSVSSGQAFALEFVATFFLMFVITAVATDRRAVRELAGLGIGGVVMLDILVIGPTTGASMNPARTLGPAIATGNYRKIWIYMVAPVGGAILGAAVYTLIKLRVEDDELPRRFRRFSR